MPAEENKTPVLRLGDQDEKEADVPSTSSS
jgi:hypothetical protein